MESTILNTLRGQPQRVRIRSKDASDPFYGVRLDAPGRAALIIIDVQNYFVSHPELAALPNTIAAFIELSNFEHILFTQFVNHPGSAHWRLLGWKQCATSPDIDIHSALRKFIRPVNLFRKDTYSIFNAPGLVRYLRRHAVNDLFLCGADIDSCVLASAFDAFDRGYRVVIPDGLSLSHSGYTECAIKIITRNFVPPTALATHPSQNEPLDASAPQQEHAKTR